MLIAYFFNATRVTCWWWVCNLLIKAFLSLSLLYFTSAQYTMNVVLTVRTLILSDNTLTWTIVIISFLYDRVADDSYSSSRRIRKDRPNYSRGILSANDNEDRKYKQVEENDESVVNLLPVTQWESIALHCFCWRWEDNRTSFWCCWLVPISITKSIFPLIQ